MAEFAYNNTKNASISHILFEFNCGYHPRVFFKENVDFYSKSRFVNELVKELRELMEICCQNLLYTQKRQKRTYGKKAKSRNYTLGKKV